MNHMFNMGIRGVNFIVCNTDAQALDLSPVPNKVQLGPGLTEGRGAGANPEIGRKATEESLEDLRNLLEGHTKMVFITAGMGGGTGTGGAPVIARLARELDILTVGIVTLPFHWEGAKKQHLANEGIAEMRQYVDAIIIISNDKLKEMYGNLRLSEAFAKVDGVLLTAAKGIAEIITVPGYVNVDFEDVRTVMTQSGVAIMGSAEAEGEHRALRAVESALSSPLLNDNDIRGAKNILLNITSGTEEILLDEIDEITKYVQEEAGTNTDIIWGNCYDDSLGNKISVTVIATGFDNSSKPRKEAQKVHIPLDEEHPEEEQLIEPDPVPEKQSEPELRGQQQTTLTFELEPEISNSPVIPDNNELTDSQGEEEGFRLHTRAPDDRQPGPVIQNPADREQTLRRLSMSLDDIKSIEALEKEPAFKRKDVELQDVEPSSENNVSRFTLSSSVDEDGEEEIKLRKNNRYLHDNVD